MNSVSSASRVHRAAQSFINACALSGVLGLAACGGGDSSSPPTPGLNALASVAIEPAGTHCASGGSVISAGMDSNRNGVLDTTEITSASYVCNGTAGTTGGTGSTGATGATGAAGIGGATGAAGTPGISTLLQMLSEPSGLHCLDGGSRIIAGLDTDGSGVLDPSEVTVTSYVCGGAPGVAGANGTNGTNGVSSLMSVTSEPAGANCAGGGVLIASGLDGNADSTLQPGEVTNTQYVCHGSQGATGATGATGAAGATGPTGAAGLSVLISTVSESAGANCLHGGTRITSGQDADRSNVLEAGEVSATSYVCNGPGITWFNVNTAAAQASSNAGYLVETVVRATVTLPAAPAVGDIVRISGVGSGGWQIGQNAGQSIITRGVPTAFATTSAGSIWTTRDSARNWFAMTSSANGNKLAAVDQGGQIYTSIDAGITWTARDSNRNWSGIASSADGNKLVAVENGGHIYISIDSGVNWTAFGPTRPWMRVASSADGTKLVAVANTGQIYTSTDSGVTWTPRETDRDWFSVASSADGTKLAAVAMNSQIYTSDDSGVTWTARESNRVWLSIASSADGNKLVAGTMNGRIYTSSDAGVSWVARGSVGSWFVLTSSADGSKLATIFSGDFLYTSIDSGVTWTARESIRNWEALASSADGNKLVAAEQGGLIYTSVGGATTPGTAGWLRGEQYDAIELQYVGNGVFIPLSFSNGSSSGITGN